MARIKTAPVVVPEAEIARALRRLRGLLTAETPAGLRGVHLAVDADGDFYAEATNGRDHGRIYLDAEVADPSFEAYPRFLSLVEAVKGMTVCRLTIRRNWAQGSPIVCVDGDQARREAQQAGIDWPGWPELSQIEPVLHMEATAFAAAVNRVAWFVSTDATRPFLQQVRLRDGRLYATDSFRLARIHLSAGHGWQGRCAVDGRVLRHAVKAVHSGGVLLEAEPRWVWLRRTNEEWMLRQYEADGGVELPDYESFLINEESSERYAYDGDVCATGMHEALSAAAEVLAAPRAIVAVTFGKRHVVLRDQEGVEHGRIKVQAARTESLRVLLNVHYGKDLFGALAPDTVRVRCRGPERPLAVSGPRGDALLQPVREWPNA